MGGGLFSALNAARTSLEVNQKSIEVIGNNISNVNTEGYSRQSAHFDPYPAMNFGGFFVGQGVKVTDVRREHDVFIQNQLQEKSINFGLQNGLTRPLAELERIFNITEDNLATELDKFFDSWQELSTDPSSLVARDIVIQRGENLSTLFNNTANDLDTIKANLNDSIRSKIDSINSAITEIADLNERIFNIEVQGQSANSARDRRDVLAKELAESIGAETHYFDHNGMMTVNLPSGLPLVQGNLAMTLEAVTVGSSLELRLHAGGVTRTLVPRNLDGEIGGLVEMRDVFIPDLENDLDRLAYEVSVEVNNQHRLGADLNGNVDLYFFSDPTASPPPLPADPWEGAARNMSVVLTDASQVAAAADPGTGFPPPPGDNRNSNIISNIGDTFLIDGVDNFNSFYGKITAKVGIESSQNQLSLQGAQDAVDQLENFRDGIAGVSLEEEMISLIQFQRGFESSAKFLSTVDEMMNSLINIKR